MHLCNLDIVCIFFQNYPFFVKIGQNFCIFKNSCTTHKNGCFQTYYKGSILYERSNYTINTFKNHLI